MANSEPSTVILGTGIIGLSTAYYLSQFEGVSPNRIHLVDSASTLFDCASGFAGGFLAADCALSTVTSQPYLNVCTAGLCGY